jgi:hypothetical protein
MQLNFSLPYREHDTACAVYVGKMLPPCFKMFIPLEASGFGEEVWKKLLCNVNIV